VFPTGCRPFPSVTFPVRKDWYVVAVESHFVACLWPVIRCELGLRPIYYRPYHSYLLLRFVLLLFRGLFLIFLLVSCSTWMLAGNRKGTTDPVSSACRVIYSGQECICTDLPPGLRSLLLCLRRHGIAKWALALLRKLPDIIGVMAGG